MRSLRMHTAKKTHPSRPLDKEGVRTFPFLILEVRRIFWSLISNQSVVSFNNLVHYMHVFSVSFRCSFLNV